jgi:hypothetical protein
MQTLIPYFVFYIFLLDFNATQVLRLSLENEGSVRVDVLATMPPIYEWYLGAEDKARSEIVRLKRVVVTSVKDAPPAYCFAGLSCRYRAAQSLVQRRAMDAFFQNHFPDFLILVPTAAEETAKESAAVNFAVEKSSSIGQPVVHISGDRNCLTMVQGHFMYSLEDELEQGRFQLTESTDSRVMACQQIQNRARGAFIAFRRQHTGFQVVEGEVICTASVCRIAQDAGVPCGAAPLKASVVLQLCKEKRARLVQEAEATVEVWIPSIGTDKAWKPSHFVPLSNAKTVQNIVDVVFVCECIEQLVHPQALMHFREEWILDDGTPFVSTWPVGHFLQYITPLKEIHSHSRSEEATFLASGKSIESPLDTGFPQHTNGKKGSGRVPSQRQTMQDWDRRPFATTISRRTVANEKVAPVEAPVETAMANDWFATAQKLPTRESRYNFQATFDAPRGKGMVPGVRVAVSGDGEYERQENNEVEHLVCSESPVLATQKISLDARAAAMKSAKKRRSPSEVVSQSRMPKKKWTSPYVSKIGRSDIVVGMDNSTMASVVMNKRLGENTPSPASYDVVGIRQNPAVRPGVGGDGGKGMPFGASTASKVMSSVPKDIVPPPGAYDAEELPPGMATFGESPAFKSSVIRPPNLPVKVVSFTSDHKGVDTAFVNSSKIKPNAVFHSTSERNATEKSETAAAPVQYQTQTSAFVEQDGTKSWIFASSTNRLKPDSWGGGNFENATLPKTDDSAGLQNFYETLDPHATGYSNDSPSSTYVSKTKASEFYPVLTAGPGDYDPKLQLQTPPSASFSSSKVGGRQSPDATFNVYGISPLKDSRDQPGPGAYSATMMPIVMNHGRRPKTTEGLVKLHGSLQSATDLKESPLPNVGVITGAITTAKRPALPRKFRSNRKPGMVSGSSGRRKLVSM